MCGVRGGGAKNVAQVNSTRNFQQCQFSKNHTKDIPFAQEHCVLTTSVPVRTSPVPAQLSAGAATSRPGVQAPEHPGDWPLGLTVLSLSSLPAAP